MKKSFLLLTISYALFSVSAHSSQNLRLISIKTNDDYTINVSSTSAEAVEAALKDKMGKQNFL